MKSKEQLALEYMLEDKQLHKLYEAKMQFLYKAPPKFIPKSSDKGVVFEMVPADTSEYDKLITHRQQQILNHFK